MSIFGVYWHAYCPFRGPLLCWSFLFLTTLSKLGTCFVKVHYYTEHRNLVTMATYQIIITIVIQDSKIIHHIYNLFFKFLEVCYIHTIHSLHAGMTERGLVQFSAVLLWTVTHIEQFSVQSVRAVTVIGGLFVCRRRGSRKTWLPMTSLCPQESLKGGVLCKVNFLDIVPSPFIPRVV